MGAISLSRPGLGLRLVPLRLLSDERLGELAHRGDAEAFGTLYERYRVQLSRYCRSIVRDREDAHDALQSAMASALQALRTRAPRGPLRPWLYRIAHNESVSILRRRRSHDELSDEIPSLERGDSGRERWEMLLVDLWSLPERQRGALVMRELGGLEYREIGSALRMSGAAARNAVFEARVALNDLAIGRDSPCDEIRAKISDGDGRALRGRRMRAHLAACPTCAAFVLALNERREQLALIPSLPAGAWLAGGAASTAGAGGVALGGGSASALLAKGAALCSACAVLGAGVVVDKELTKPAHHSPRRAHAAPRHHRHASLVARRPETRAPARVAAPSRPAPARTSGSAGRRPRPYSAKASGPIPRRVVTRPHAPPKPATPAESITPAEAPTSTVATPSPVPAASTTPTPPPATTASKNASWPGSALIQSAWQLASRLGGAQIQAALAQAQQSWSSAQALLYSFLHPH